MATLLQDCKDQDDLNIYYIKELQLELINLARLFNNGEITPHEIIKKLDAEIECVLEGEISLLEDIKKLENNRDNRIIELKEKYGKKELTKLEKYFYPRCLDNLFEGELKALADFKKELEQYRENLQDVSYKIFVASENPEYWKMRRNKIGNDKASLDKHPEIIRELINAGQIKYENGEYKIIKNMKDFIAWCSENGYIDDGSTKEKYKDILTPEYIFYTFKHNCKSIESIKRYFAGVKTTKKEKKT
ncbi:hypothetical protein AGMMS49944_12510 [Spirochaetia bacterium]|nr:hypothetical protein AGMMS49944_12510 [Spirochaetia bacterium]